MCESAAPSTTNQKCNPRIYIKDKVARKSLQAYSIKMQYEIVFKSDSVAKMASPAIFQYSVLAIDDTHNTWTNVFAQIIFSGFQVQVMTKRRQAKLGPKSRPYGGSAD